MSKKAERVLKIFEQLQRGPTNSKQELAEEFNVTKKTIGDDIRDLKSHFAEQRSKLGGSGKFLNITYNKEEDGYVLTGDESWLTGQELFFVLKVLLESRSLSEKRMEKLVDKLVSNLISDHQDLKKDLNDFLRQEKESYKPAAGVKENNPAIIDKLWQLARAVRKKQLVDIWYRKESAAVKAGERAVKNHLVKPLNLEFYNHYFYLRVKLAKREDIESIVLRLDRITEYEVKEEHFDRQTVYKQQIKDGSYQKKAPLMQSGELIKVKFRYWGPSLESLRDRFPTAEVVETNGQEWIIEAEVYDTEGTKTLLLGHREWVEVLEPQSLREEMKEVIKRMQKIY